MLINKFDRVLVQNQYQHFETEIGVGTVCTVRDFITDDTALVQYDYNFEKQEPIFAGLPIAILRKVNLEELSQVTDCKSLVPKIYQPGNCFVFNKGERESEIGSIDKIELAENELDDIITLKFNDNSLCSYTRTVLDKYSSRVGTSESQNIKEQNLSETKKPVIKEQIIEDKNTNEDITIIIDGLVFRIDPATQLIKSTMTVNMLEQYVQALTKLNNLINDK